MSDGTQIGERRTPCPVTRLAKGEVTSVDVCECGTMQVNLGAFTLRVSPETVAEIATTLNAALVTYNRMREEREQEQARERLHIVEIKDMEA